MVGQISGCLRSSPECSESSSGRFLDIPLGASPNVRRTCRRNSPSSLRSSFQHYDREDAHYTQKTFPYSGVPIASIRFKTLKGDTEACLNQVADSRRRRNGAARRSWIGVHPKLVPDTRHYPMSLQCQPELDPLRVSIDKRPYQRADCVGILQGHHVVGCCDGGDFGVRQELPGAAGDLLGQRPE